MPIEVNVDNYARAEVAFQIDRFLAFGCGHQRLDPHPESDPDRPAVGDPDEPGHAVQRGRHRHQWGATVTVPATDGRYLTVMIMNADGYVNRVVHEPGIEPLDGRRVRHRRRHRHRPHPGRPDRPRRRGRGQPAPGPAHHRGGLGAALGDRSVRRGELRQDETPPARPRRRHPGLRPDLRRQGGRRPGALPDRDGGWLRRSSDRRGLLRHPRRTATGGSVRSPVADVPVDGFWSVSVYNRDGYFDENPYDSYSVNSVTAVPDPEGRSPSASDPSRTGRPTSCS